MNIDKAFTELETIVERMEKQSQTIEQSITDYQAGMTLVKELRKSLTDVEKKIQILNTETGEITEEETMDYTLLGDGDENE